MIQYVFFAQVFDQPPVAGRRDWSAGWGFDYGSEIDMNA
jgi:hypothetical protein